MKNKKKLFFYILKDMTIKTLSFITRLVLTGLCLFGMLFVGANVLYLVWKAFLLTLKPFVENMDTLTTEGLAIILIVGGYGIFLLVANLILLIKSVIKHMTSYFNEVQDDFYYKYPDQDTQVTPKVTTTEENEPEPESEPESEYESDSQTFTWLKANTTVDLSTVVYYKYAYARDEFGSGFSLTKKNNSHYVGVYFTQEEGQSLNPLDYEWHRIIK